MLVDPGPGMEQDRTRTETGPGTELDNNEE